jgi:thiamine biosynthesis lipoprotein
VISRLAGGELAEADVGEEVAQVLAGCRLWQERTDGWFSAWASGRLDPSGYVKGWAIARASDLLIAAGSTSHCVNGGGDVQCVGSADGRPWQVGLADPRDPHTILRVVAGVGIAVATSGTAERGAHVIDPHNRRPATELLSLSVAGTSILDCDVLATAGLAMGAAAQDYFRARSDVRALGVLPDGTTWSTFPGSGRVTLGSSTAPARPAVDVAPTQV